MSKLVKTKRQANLKDFKRFGSFKGLVEQKNVVFNSFVCKLCLFWHSWAFKTLVSLAFNNGPLVRKNKLLLHLFSTHSLAKNKNKPPRNIRKKLFIIPTNTLIADKYKRIKFLILGLNNICKNYDIFFRNS
jgi:hypothetical protein